MNKNKYKLIALIASIMFVLLITVTTCTLFLFPSPLYAEDVSVCWDCFNWGNGYKECGMDYSGSTGCTHANGYCQLDFAMCIIAF